MFQLAHISDIHLSPLPTPRLYELMGKRLTGYINWKKNRTSEMGRQTLDALMESIKQKQADHLVISGDLVNLSLPREFARAKDWLVAQGPASDISLTFGNHDAYVGGAFKKACKTFRPWITSEEAHILHGHTHVPSLEHIDGKERDVPVVGVASASQAFGGKKPPANYNWFTIDGDCESWHCALERYTVVNSENDINCTENIPLF